MRRQLGRTSTDEPIECVVEVMLIACLQRSYANGRATVCHGAASDHPVAMADLSAQMSQHNVQLSHTQPWQVQCLVMDTCWQSADKPGARKIHDMDLMPRARLRGCKVEDLTIARVQSPGSKNVRNGEWEFRRSQHQAARQRPLEWPSTGR